MKLTDVQQREFLRLIQDLLDFNESDDLSSDSTKALIRKNITGLKVNIETGETLTPSEYGKPLGLGLTRGIGEFNVSDEVLEAAHQIEAYFRTL